MLKMVDGTGIIGVDMICPLGVSTPQPPNYDRVELEGTGILVLPNSLNALLERLELGGKTEQVQTSGKQLFDAKNAELNKWVGSTGIIATVGRNCIFRLNVKPNTVYQVNILSASSTFSFSQFSKENVFLERTVFSKGTKSFKCTTTEDVDYAYFLIGDTVDNINGIINDVMLYEGEEYKNYEPYTGGKPSPSQEYQQEIKSVGKWNEGTQKYEVSVKVTGRNLFNGKLSKGKFITDDMNVVSDLVTMNTFDKPVEIEPNTDYVISANGVIWEGNINVYDENGKKIVQHFTGKFKTPSNAKYIRASISNARAPIDSKIQMEYGTAMNEFEQYHQPQSLTLTSDRPLTKWDRLVEQGGQIGWLYKSAVVKNFNGDGYKIQSAGNIGNVNKYSIVFPDALIKGNATADIYVDRYRGINASYAKEEYGICCNWNDGIKYFNAPNETVKTVDDFKKWLTENPLTIAYETESTEFVPLPEEEQNAIRALKTYYPTTVITADGGELDPDIKATYRKEI